MPPPPTVTIVGVGRLGLCVSLVLESKGYDVLGVDVRRDYVESLNDRSFRSDEPQVSEYLGRAQRFRATASLDAGLDHAQLILVLVDTPAGKTADQSYDHHKLSSVLSAIGQAGARAHHKHVVIGCTVQPGYVRQIGRFLLRHLHDTSLSYNPEFIAQGAIIAGLLRPDLVLIGEGSRAAGDALEALARRTADNEPVVSRMAPESAELTKLAVNCYVTMKIAFANAVADVARATPGADPAAVMDAVGHDRRIGHAYLRPGFGFGGPCFPRDNRALGAHARAVGVELLLAQATDQANQQHRDLMIEDIVARLEPGAASEPVVFRDVAYKENSPVPIIEESQKLAVARGVALRGHPVRIVDRAAVISAVQQEYGNVFEYQIVEPGSNPPQATGDGDQANDQVSNKPNKKPRKS